MKKGTPNTYSPRLTHSTLSETSDCQEAVDVCPTQLSGSYPRRQHLAASSHVAGGASPPVHAAAASVRPQRRRSACSWMVCLLRLAAFSSASTLGVAKTFSKSRNEPPACLFPNQCAFQKVAHDPQHGHKNATLVNSQDHEKNDSHKESGTSNEITHPRFIPPDPKQWSTIPMLG